MQINRETFGAWLFSQPDERTFRYTESQDCLMSSFLKETTKIKNFSPAVEGRAFYTNLDTKEEIPVPEWLYSNTSKNCLLYGTLIKLGPDTFGAVKQRYITLFGNPFETSNKPVSKRDTTAAIVAVTKQTTETKKK